MDILKLQLEKMIEVRPKDLLDKIIESYENLKK